MAGTVPIGWTLLEQSSECGRGDVRPVIGVFLVHVVHHRHQNQYLLNLLLELLGLSMNLLPLLPRFSLLLESQSKSCFACVCVLQVSSLDTDASGVRIQGR